MATKKPVTPFPAKNTGQAPKPPFPPKNSGGKMPKFAKGGMPMKGKKGC